MPTAYEIRASAWRRMKDGGLLPALAGFALIFMLATAMDMLMQRVGLARGLIAEIPALELLQSIGIVVAPELERSLAEEVFPMPTTEFMVFSLVAMTLWNGIMSFGKAVLAIAVMRGGATAYQALSGFRWPFRTMGLGLLRTLIVLLLMPLLVVPCVLAWYSYRMAFFLMADHPDWSPVRALVESRRIMCGHRWRLACLDFSFFGWFLLVGVTMGLAGIFVVPYYVTANAAFYEDLLDRCDSDDKAEEVA